MPKPRARCATSWPIRPKPSTPSVFSYSSTPENFERSHLPPVSDSVRLRDVAREREQQRHRVLGGRDDVRLGRVRDDDPAPGRGRHVDVVHADAGAADHLQPLGAVDQLGGHLRGRADQDAVVVADPLAQLVLVPVDAEVDVEVLAQQLDPGVADLLLDEHARPRAVALGLAALRRRRAHRPSLSTIQSMQPVSACTSAVSTAGNMPIRSWLRPSLRYGSVSTMPFARSVAATRRGVDALVEVDRADDERAARRARRRTASRTRSAPPIRRGLARRRVVRATHPSRPPLAEHPLDLVGHQEQRRHRRRVVGLVLERSSRAPSSATGTPGSSDRSASQLGDPLLRGRAQQREPQPAVGGEALLRREVVGVGLRRCPRAARRRPRWRRSPRARPRGARRAQHRAPSRPSRSRCAPRRAGRRRPGPRPRRRAPGRARTPGSAAIVTGSARNGAPVVTVANFCENSP